MGHVSASAKNKMLGQITHDNIQVLNRQLAQDIVDKKKELDKEKEIIRQEHEELHRVQMIMDNLQKQKAMSLKERLIAQKQERLNQDLLNRQEEKRPVVTSIPYDEGAKKKPYKDGTFYKSMAIPASMTDAFKKLKNTDIERMKKASVRAAHIGPGVPQNSLDTFRLLKQDPQLITMQES